MAHYLTIKWTRSVQSFKENHHYLTHCQNGRPKRLADRVPVLAPIHLLPLRSEHLFTQRLRACLHGDGGPHSGDPGEGPGGAEPPPSYF